MLAPINHLILLLFPYPAFSIIWSEGPQITDLTSLQHLPALNSSTLSWYKESLSVDSPLRRSLRGPPSHTDIMIEDILQHLSPKTIAIAAIVVFSLVKISKRFSDERKIQALGGHAPELPSYLPFGTFFHSYTSFLHFHFHFSFSVQPKGRSKQAWRPERKE